VTSQHAIVAGAALFALFVGLYDWPRNPNTAGLSVPGQDTWILTCEPHAHVEVSTIHAQQIIVACRRGAK
jgi:hypothetical protein